MKTIRIGAGAGYAGDRIEPAVELVEKGDLDYLVFECLAERTIALAQQARRRDENRGYDSLLEARLEAVLPQCAARGIRLISNMGAANPLAAAERTAAVARELGLSGLKIAAVTGDDVREAVESGDFAVEGGSGAGGVRSEPLISANAYLGAEPLVQALADGAHIVITGRVADPALFCAPLIHEFGWAFDDWHRLGQGSLVGHLLECAGQITGGYFADPLTKPVRNLARLGFPLAEVAADGSAVITKVPGSGGEVTVRTCREQLLYEIHDPTTYLTPDVVADFSWVDLTDQGPDRVAVSGATGRPRPETLKVSLGVHDGYLGEGQITYAGPGAIERGQLALAIVRERFALTGFSPRELRTELIGLNSVLPSQLPDPVAPPPEVRARVAGRTSSPGDARRIGDEVETLYTNGPAGGGGVTKSVREIIGVRSTLIPRALASPQIHYIQS